MKRIVWIVTFIAALAFSNFGKAAEPAKTSGSDPTDTIRGFYRWYVTALIKNQEPIKNRKEMKRFTTERLLREIGKMKQGPEGLEGDYFLDAQDFDDLWAKNITVSNVKVSGSRATVEVHLSGKDEMRRHLKVDLVAEAGTWKVDKVKGLD
jgi:Protein of unknown function (DUF3828)